MKESWLGKKKNNNLSTCQDMNPQPLSKCLSALPQQLPRDDLLKFIWCHSFFVGRVKLCFLDQPKSFSETSFQTFFFNFSSQPGKGSNCSQRFHLFAGGRCNLEGVHHPLPGLKKCSFQHSSSVNCNSHFLLN